MSAKVKKVSGIVLLDPSHKNLMKTVATRLNGIGEKKLANEISSLPSLDILGKTVISRAQSKRLGEILHNTKIETATDMKLEKELKALTELFDEVDAKTNENLKRVEELGKKAAALDDRLAAAVQKSRDFTGRKPS